MRSAVDQKENEGECGEAKTVTGVRVRDIANAHFVRFMDVLKGMECQSEQTYRA